MTQEEFKEEAQRLRPRLMLTARRYLGDDDAEDTVDVRHGCAHQTYRRRRLTAEVCQNQTAG